MKKAVLIFTMLRALNTIHRKKKEKCLAHAYAFMQISFHRFFVQFQSHRVFLCTLSFDRQHTDRHQFESLCVFISFFIFFHCLESLLLHCISTLWVLHGAYSFYFNFGGVSSVYTLNDRSVAFWPTTQIQHAACNSGRLFIRFGIKIQLVQSICLRTDQEVKKILLVRIRK